MKKILCFGEPLLRLSPQLNGEWIRGHHMPVFIGGAELNVARALARWKLPVAYCTALPDHYLAKEIVHFVNENGIDTSAIRFTGSRVGTYYLPQGADLKSAGVIYDRAHSSFWELKPGEIAWDKVLEDVGWFHFSAISPALNASVAAVCLEAVKAASAKGISVSTDLNYRAKLWQYGKQPGEVMQQLVEHCEVVMGNIWAAHTMLATSLDANIHEAPRPEKYLAHAKRTSQEIMDRFPRCKVAAQTFRFDGSQNNLAYYTTLCAGTEQYNSPVYNSNRIVDRSGSGDCYMAGLIYGLTQKLPLQETVNFATAAAFGKLHEQGDATAQDPDTIYRNSRSGFLS